MSRPPRLNAIRSALALLGGRKAHWAVEDVSGPTVIRRWVVGDAPTCVYAVGATLTQAAQALEGLNTRAFDEVLDAESMLTETYEQLQAIEFVLLRMRRRAYRLAQREHYADLGLLADGVHRCLVLLQSERCPAGAAFNAWSGLRAPALEPAAQESPPAAEA